MTLTISTSGASAAVDALTALLNGGSLRLYTGTRPDTPETPLGANTLLAELHFGTPAFDDAVDGVASATPIADDPAAAATGICAFFRAVASDGSTALLDGSVSAAGGGGDLLLNTVNIVQDSAVSVTAFTLTAPTR